MTIPAFPLQWPTGWQRKPAHARTRGKFSHRGKAMTIAAGVERVREELGRLGVNDADLVINTNLKLRLDGFPRSDQGEPMDPGVAVYWINAKKPDQPPKCMAVDRYDEVQDNLAAVAATLEAMRSIERHGGAAILDRAFTGFAALPAPAAGKRDWWTVLELPATATEAQIRDAYARLARVHHPDKGGDAQRMAEINRARDEALSK